APAAAAASGASASSHSRRGAAKLIGRAPRGASRRRSRISGMLPWVVAQRPRPAPSDEGGSGAPFPPGGEGRGLGGCGGRDPIDAGKLRDTSEPRRRNRAKRAG